MTYAIIDKAKIPQADKVYGKWVDIFDSLPYDQAVVFPDKEFTRNMRSNLSQSVRRCRRDYRVVTRTKDGKLYCWKEPREAK